MNKLIISFLLNLISLTLIAQNKIAYCDFSNFPDGDITTNCYNIEGKYLDKNPHYKKSLRFLIENAYLYAEFDINENYDEVEITLEHLSSYAEAAKNNGYSPITVQINGQNVISNYSPENHGYKTEIFNITSTVQVGKNTIKIIANKIQTHYWLRKFNIYTLHY